MPLGFTFGRLFLLALGAFTFFVLVTFHEPRRRGTSQAWDQAPLAAESAPVVLVMDDLADALPALADLPLVTEAAPARDDGTLDVSRCAALHNFLVRYGWAGMGHRLRDVPRLTFFEKHEDDEEEVRDQLHPDLAAFLGSALMADETFFVFVEGISDPSDMFRGENLMPDESGDDPHRFVVLYGTNPGLGEHDVGLVYDQACHRAAMALGVEDIGGVIAPVEEHPDMWYPLETVLTKWIELIRAGKVTTRKDPYTSGISEDDVVSVDGDEEESEDADSLFDPDAYTEWAPWIWHSYGPAQVATTVAAFHRLVEAIESRMPAGTETGAGAGAGVGAGSTPAPHGSTAGSASAEPRLFSDEDLDAARVPDECFVRSFLTRARRPVFTRIAPGLVIVDNDAEAFSRAQRFTPLRAGAQVEEDEPLDGTVVPPVLIFPAQRGTTNYAIPISKLLSNLTDLSGSWPRYLRQAAQEDDESTTTISAGLYSEGVERRDLDSAEEGFRLLLIPGPGASNAAELHARKSDGTLLDRVDSQVAGLFQHGHKPFGGEWWRPQRLERLLDQWATLVETGVWTVGPDGVDGTVDTFVDGANAAGGGWRHYWIPPDW